MLRLFSSKFLLRPSFPFRSFSVITSPFPSNSPVDLSIGDSMSLTRSFSAADVSSFANLICDHNPLHSPNFQPNFSSPFGRPIVHGWLTGSMFSSVLAHFIPGAIYVNQEIKFRAPLGFDEKATATITVKDLAKSSRGFVICSTVITNEANRVIADGTALVLIQNLKQIQQKKVLKFE